MHYDIGRNWRKYKNAKNFKKNSQEGLANKIKKSQTWMQQVEKGEIDISITMLGAVAQELGVTLLKLLSFSPNNVFNNCIQCGGDNNTYIMSGDELIKILNANKKN